jgi:hypothetical protein
MLPLPPSRAGFASGRTSPAVKARARASGLYGRRTDANLRGARGRKPPVRMAQGSGTTKQPPAFRGGRPLKTEEGLCPLRALYRSGVPLRAVLCSENGLAAVPVARAHLPIEEVEDLRSALFRERRDEHCELAVSIQHVRADFLFHRIESDWLISRPSAERLIRSRMASFKRPARRR